jgi:peptide/nickel transport system substrate-binding protein
MGTGGYRLVSFEAGVRGLSKRHPNYWKEGRAHFDEVEVINITDPNARTTALKTGAVDLIDRVERKTAHLLKRDSSVELLNIKGFKFFDFPMLVDVPPYDNNDARLALKYAVDRQQMVDKILSGFGTVGNDHPISSILKFHAADLPQRQYDPEKARHHLKKAGLEGHIFKLHTAEMAFQGAVDAAVLYREQAAKAGINIEVVREPGDGYWSNVWINKPWCAGSWSGRPTADMMFTVGFAADAAWNYTRWKNKHFNELMLAARAELDEQKRAEMYFNMQQLVRDEGGTIIPMYANYVEAASTKLKHGPVAGNWELDGTKAPERWWFA